MGRIIGGSVNTELDKDEEDFFRDTYLKYHRENQDKLTKVYKDTRMVMLLAFVEFHGLENNFKEFETAVRRTL
jgi:hypothetical protein